MTDRKGDRQEIRCLFSQEKKIPEWFRSRTSVITAHTSRVVRKQEITESLSFWFRNKFLAISLCLVIGLGNEQPLTVKFSPRVFINGKKQCIGCQKVYEFMITTDHVLLLKFEDNGELVFSDNKWNHVEVSYADHNTNDEIPIRQVARDSGIHVFEKTIDPGDIQFTSPLETMINLNLNPNSMEGADQRITAERPQKYQRKVFSSPIADAIKGPVTKPILPAKRSLEYVIGQTIERLPEDEVHPTTISNGPPIIRSCPKDDDIELETVSFCELESEKSPSNTEGSDSGDPFDCVDRRLSINAKETQSLESSSEDASLGSIREAINALDLLMIKDLSEISSDPDTQSEFHQLFDLLSTSSYHKLTVEVKEAIVEFKRKALLSFQEFQSTVESVNKLKHLEMQLARIQLETVAGKGRNKDLKSSIKKVSLGIEAENSRKNELEAEIATIRRQIATKEMELEQLVLNLKKQQETLSTHSTSYDSLNEQGRALLKQVDDLLAAKSGVKHESKVAEVKQSRLKLTWSIGLTSQFNMIKTNIIDLLRL